MAKSNTTRNDLVKLIFNNTALSWAGNTTFYVALHSADPGAAGTQSTNEITYTGYARVAVARTSGGFTVSGNSATNTADISFVQNTGATTATATHFSVGLASSGAGQILYSGAISNTPVSITPSMIPKILASQLIITES